MMAAYTNPRSTLILWLRSIGVCVGQPRGTESFMCDPFHPLPL